MGALKLVHDFDYKKKKKIHTERDRDRDVRVRQPRIGWMMDTL